MSDSKIKYNKNMQIFCMKVDANFLKFKKSKNPLCKKMGSRYPICMKFSRDIQNFMLFQKMKRIN